MAKTFTKKIKYTDEIINNMIKRNQYDFIDYVDNEKIIQLCEKHNSNKILKELLKRNFFRISEIILMIDSDIWLFASQRLFYEDLFEEMLKTNYEETLKLMEKHSYKMNGLVENSNYLEITNILIKNGFSSEDYKKISTIRSSPFLLTLLKNNVKQTLIENDSCDLDSLLRVSNAEIIKKLCDAFSDLRLEDLPKAALENKQILSHYIKDKNKATLILTVISSLSYSKENEIELLKMFNNKYSSVEEIIKNMYHKENNKRRDNMTIYEILALQIYAQKYLKKAGIDMCDIDMFKYSGEKKYGRASQMGLTPCISVMNHNNSVLEFVRILHHEMAHIQQRKMIDSMDLKLDVDLYTKDTLLKAVNKDFKDDFRYYNDNYSYLSIEYYAEYRSYLETAELFEEKISCYDKFKLDVKSLPHEFIDLMVENGLPLYYYDVNRKGKDGSIIHINDLVELHLDNILKDEELRNKIEDEAPLILYEYDIEKDTIPRRRTIEQLVYLLNNSIDEKEKDIYLMLLVNRFDGRKEKAEDVKSSVKQVKEMLLKEKISKKQADFLLSSIIKSENVSLSKHK